jgi:ubiquinone/menaquinone biosynthesis C-methylase UbiE
VVERLADARELLDGPLDDAAALRANLRDLRRINRLIGGVDLSRRAIAALSAGVADLSILDVGTGGADIPVALLEDARRRGRVLRMTAVDNRAEVLVAAREACPEIEGIDGLALELADGASLPYADGTFDIAHASLMLHHLEPADAVPFLTELARVSTRGVVLNDLSRGRALVAGAWLLSRLMTRCRYTRHDAPLSVRRAYTAAEARELLLAASLEPVFEAHAPFGHRWVLAGVRSG